MLPALVAAAALLFRLTAGTATQVIAASLRKSEVWSISTQSYGQRSRFNIHSLEAPALIDSDPSSQLLYWVGGGQGARYFIGSFNYATGAESILVELADGARVVGLAVHHESSSVYYADASDGVIKAVRTDTKALSDVTAGVHPSFCCLTVSRKSGALYWKEATSELGAATRDGIYSVEPLKAAEQRLLYTERKPLETQALATDQTGRYVFWCSRGAAGDQALLKFDAVDSVVFNIPLLEIDGNCSGLSVDDTSIYLLTSYDNRTNALYAISLQNSSAITALLRPDERTDFTGIASTDFHAAAAGKPAATNEIPTTASPSAVTLGLAIGLPVSLAVATAASVSIACVLIRKRKRKISRRRKIEIISAYALENAAGPRDDALSDKEFTPAGGDEANSISEGFGKKAARANSYVIQPPKMATYASSDTLFEKYDEPARAGYLGEVRPSASVGGGEPRADRPTSSSAFPVAIPAISSATSLADYEQPVSSNNDSVVATVAKTYGSDALVTRRQQNGRGGSARFAGAPVAPRADAAVPDARSAEPRFALEALPTAIDSTAGDCQADVYETISVTSEDAPPELVAGAAACAAAAVAPPRVDCGSGDCAVSAESARPLDGDGTEAEGMSVYDDVTEARCAYDGAIVLPSEIDETRMASVGCAVDAVCRSTAPEPPRFSPSADTYRISAAAGVTAPKDGGDVQTGGPQGGAGSPQPSAGGAPFVIEASGPNAKPWGTVKALREKIWTQLNGGELGVVEKPPAAREASQKLSSGLPSAVKNVSEGTPPLLRGSDAECTSAQRRHTLGVNSGRFKRATMDDVNRALHTTLSRRQPPAENIATAPASFQHSRKPAEPPIDYR